MKGILTVLLVITGCTATFAQNKHNLFVGAGINNPGISATYDWKLVQNFDMGIGVSAYNIDFMPDVNILRSALYLDIRPNWAIKRSLLFLFVNIGGVYNTVGTEPDSSSISRINVHTALGFGYGYMINKRGMGPYASVGLYGYSITVHSDKANLTPRARDYSIFEAVSIISLGFKF